MDIKLADDNFIGTVSPTDREREVARVSLQRLSSMLGQTRDDFHIQVEEESVAVPQSVAKMLLEILAQMAQGNAITMIPSHAELTTQEAADTLNVSRPFLVKLLEQGKLPFRNVGSHRRVLFSDLMGYMQRAKVDRLKALEELQKDAQENVMGY